MVANVLRHERFETISQRLYKRRRGPLPRGVASIKHACRLKIGALAEIVGGRTIANVGIRVRITGFDPKSPYCWECKSLDRDFRCNDGALDRVGWFKGKHLRRLWTDLSERERIQLGLRRAAS